jgi:hypothetical protein
MAVRLSVLHAGFTLPPEISYGTKISWPESASELYQPSDRHLSLNLVPTFADRGCPVVSVTVPYGRNLGFLDRSHYFSENLVAPGIEPGPLDL